MKVILTILITCLFFFIKAQENGFIRGTSYFDIGIGIGNFPLKKDFDNAIIPTTKFSFTSGISNKIGIGYISAGSYIGFAYTEGDELIYKYYNNSQFNYLNTAYSAKFLFYAICIRYHIDLWEITREPFFQRFDSNIGLAFGNGHRFQNYKNISNLNDYNETALVANLIVGARFYFTKTISTSLEICAGTDNSVYLGVGFKIK